MKGICIAVDGPGSSGKGTVARRVARELGYQYVDTGAMYRALALLARRSGVAWDDEPALAALAIRMGVRFSWDGEALRVTVDGEDWSRSIRQDEIGSGASHVSRLPAVREALLARQRALASEGGVVMDGRDIGTVILPNAELKIYLDADLDERAARRHDELVERGEMVTLAQVRSALEARDRSDTDRAVAPLRPADDALVIDSTELTPRQVVERVLDEARKKLALLGN